MPHQCVRCNAFYADDAKEIMHGCSACKGKLFFYIKQAKLEQAKELSSQLTDDQRQELKADVADIIGEDIDESENAVVLDLESIRVPRPGVYELDLVQLFMDGRPVIYKLGEGKYVVDLIETFNKLARKK